MNPAVISGSSTVCAEFTASLFRVARTEVIVDRPADEVWAVLTDLSFDVTKLWNPDVVSVEHVSGEPGRENEFVLVSKTTLSSATRTRMAPFYMRTVRMVPCRQRVLRIDAVDGSICGFVDHSLDESGGKTRVIYNGYLEQRRVPGNQLEAFDAKKAEEGMMSYLNHSHQLLKQVVEQRRSGK